MVPKRNRGGCEPLCKETTTLGRKRKKVFLARSDVRKGGRNQIKSLKRRRGKDESCMVKAPTLKEKKMTKVFHQNGWVGR